MITVAEPTAKTRVMPKALKEVNVPLKIIWRMYYLLQLAITVMCLRILMHICHRVNEMISKNANDSPDFGTSIVAQGCSQDAKIRSINLE
jgi:hypothetical protein